MMMMIRCSFDDTPSTALSTVLLRQCSVTVLLQRHYFNSDPSTVLLRQRSFNGAPLTTLL